MNRNDVDGIIEYYKKLREIKNYDRVNNEGFEGENNPNRNKEHRAKTEPNRDRTENKINFRNIDDFDFSKKIICIFGLNMCGKTTLAKHIAQQYNSVIFDILGEFDYNIYDVYIPKNKTYPNIAKEFELFISKIKDMDYDLIVVDEANRIFPNRRSLLPEFRSFIDTYRHYNKAIIFIARRPTQLNTDLVELAHYLIIFNLKGKNDVDYLNAINRNLGEIVYNLPPYNFVVVDWHRDFYICKPIPLKNV